MRLIFLLACFMLACIGGTGAQSPADTLPAAPNPFMVNEDSLRQVTMAQRAQIAAKMAVADIRYFIIRVPDQQFGYTIFIDGHLYIEQKSIPAVQGNAGFMNKEDAEKVAKFVIEKIKSGEMPPTLGVEELKMLGVL